jgi:hypothetical protein
MRLQQAADQVRNLSDADIRQQLAERGMANASEDISFLRSNLAMGIAFNYNHGFNAGA